MCIRDSTHTHTHTHTQLQCIHTAATTTIGFNAISITTTEGAPATACAQVMGGQQLDRDIVFNMSTTDVSALSGQDYTSLSAELSFNPTNDQQLLCMSIATTDDSLDEVDEIFFVGITTNAPQVSVNPNRTTVTILDDNQLTNDNQLGICDPNL